MTQQVLPQWMQEIDQEIAEVQAATSLRKAVWKALRKSARDEAQVILLDHESALVGFAPSHFERSPEEVFKPGFLGRHDVETTHEPEAISKGLMGTRPGLRLICTMTIRPRS